MPSGREAKAAPRRCAAADRRAKTPKESRRAARVSTCSTASCQVSNVDPTHQIEISLQIVFGELAVADDFAVLGVYGERLVKRLNRFGKKPVLKLRHTLVVVAVQQIGAGVLILA